MPKGIIITTSEKYLHYYRFVTVLHTITKLIGTELCLLIDKWVNVKYTCMM